MQWLVWGGIKYTSQMHTLNKIMQTKDTLLYKYRGDPSITIGILGMVDETMGVSGCGVTAVEKNSEINYFVETHRFNIHEDKSCVIHVENKNNVNRLVQLSKCTTMTCMKTLLKSVLEMYSHLSVVYHCFLNTDAYTNNRPFQTVEPEKLTRKFYKKNS